MGLFPNALDQDVFYGVYLTWIVFTFFIERIIITARIRSRVRARRDRGSILVIFLSVFVSLGVAFGFAGAGITLLPDWVFNSGIVLMVMGIFVREWAVTTLRGYFSFSVRVLEEHKVIESGPYHFVRHPAYTGSILTIIGIGLALRTWAGVLLLLAFSAIAYGYRIRVEETTLVNELGKKYSDYMRRTKRLIPFVL